jgi:2-polyprenyl-3-methyl-5-hydroxy-6-metoxy-1,4-benzoquinol methylase
MTPTDKPFDSCERYFTALESNWNRISYPLIMPHVVEALQANRPRRILDLGRGTGVYGRLLSSQGARVSGTDLSPEAIRPCRQSPHDQVKQCDAEHVDFPAETFDLVFTSEVLEHVDDYRAMLREIFRLLKPGGVVLLTTTLYGTSVYQMIYAYHGGFPGFCRNIGLYLLGFWNHRAAKEFVLRWCYEPLGGHFHGFHARQLASDFRDCGFVVHRGFLWVAP